MWRRFGVGLGAAGYVAGSLAAPGAALALGLDRASGLPEGSLLALGLLVAVPVLVGVLAVRSPRRVEPVRQPRMAVGLAAVPVAAALVAVGAAVVWSIAALAPAVLGLLVALAGLQVLRTAATALHARRSTAGAERLAALPEVATRGPTRTARLTNVLLGVGFLAVGLPGALDGSPWSGFLAVGAVGFLIAALQADRSLSVTDAGVLVETRFTARCYEWDDFEGYYRGEHLALLRRGWWRSDLLFDPDVVEDDALAAIDRHLVEAAHRTVPAGGLPVREDATAGER